MATLGCRFYIQLTFPYHDAISQYVDRLEYMSLNIKEKFYLKLIRIKNYSANKSLPRLIVPALNEAHRERLDDMVQSL